MKHLQYHLNKLIAISILLILFVIPTNVKAIKQATSNFYVNDYANVLSEDVEKHIMDNSVALYNADKTQIVVSVVESLEGMVIEDYALNMFRDFGIGDKEKNNGILILLSTTDRKVRIEVGYGLEGIINDAKAGRIIDNYMIPDLKNNNWESGIKKGYDALFAEIVHQNNLQLNYDKTYIEDDSDGISLILSLILFIILTPFNIIFGYKLRKKNDKKSKKIASRYCIILFILTFISGIISILNFMVFTLFLMMFIFLFSYSGLKGMSISSSFSGGSSSSGSSFSGGGGSSGGGGASRGF